MKKNIILLMTAVFGVFVLAGCSEDDLNKTSAVLDSPTVENDFDRWLAKNYMEPYNIDFKYRFKDVLGDMDYNLTPADYGQAIKLAKLTLHLTLQVYDEVTGSRQFISENFPKIVHVIGSPVYNENNNIVLGVAEGGKMMTLYQVNIIDYLLSTKNIAQLNELFFKTMHHEFGHILHQTRPYSTDFNAVTPSSYVGDACFTTYQTDRAARQAGFITRYSSKAPDEDFVEQLSLYVTSTAAEWEAILAQGGSAGRPLLEQKNDIMRAYMLSTWDINIDELRKVVLRRQNEIWSLDYNI